MQNYWRRRQRACFPSSVVTSIMTMALLFGMLAVPIQTSAQDKPAAAGSAQVAKAVGTIKTVQPDSITVAAESGGDVTAQLSASTKILRVPPGEKDLKNAIPLQAQDLQPGDRVLIRGQASPNADAHRIAALSVIVMKQSDVAAKQQHDRDDWQKRGVGGLVTKVDAPANTVTISSGGMGAVKNISIHTSKDTVLRRYAPDSVKFDDAKSAPLDQIKAGDQLRALGTRSADGNDLSAEEVVSGAFRNIAGTIKTIDLASNTMTVQDAIAKSPVVVKVSPDSQMKKLPPEMAQRIATRLKAAGGTSGDQQATGAQSQGQGAGGGRQGGSQGAGSGARRGGESQAGRGPGGNGPPDIQRMLARLPDSKLTDLQKGDAVMIVSTQGSDSGAVTAITLLAGVDPILTAAPNRSASSLLSPWSLSTGGGEGESAP
jgi:hypothetical protein